MSIEQEIEQAILDIFKQEYCKEYVGDIEVTKLTPIGYKVRLGMNNTDKPIYIAAELEKDSFLKYFRQEVRDRDFDTVNWFTGYMYNSND